MLQNVNPINKNAYDGTAKKLANMFIKNFKEFEKGTAEEIIAAGPKTYKINRYAISEM